ncbi:hypothetical protein LEMLEM_LOCUS27076 [Lemmus lemmus]
MDLHVGVMLLREVVAARVAKRNVGHIEGRTWLKGRSSQDIEILSLSFPTLLITCERPCWVAAASYSGGIFILLYLYECFA